MKETETKTGIECSGQFAGDENSEVQKARRAQACIVSDEEWNVDALHFVNVTSDQVRNSGDSDAASTRKLFLSDFIKCEDIQPNKFNLIVSGCGSGKTSFVERTLPRLLSSLEYRNFVFTSSRLAAVEQAASGECMRDMKGLDFQLAKSIDDEDIICNPDDIFVCTTAFFASIILKDPWFMKDKKVVIFDECHSLFIDDYMRGNGVILGWLYAALMHTDKIIIGLTATPEPVLEYFGHKEAINLIDYQHPDLYPYKTKKLVLSQFCMVPDMVKEFAAKGERTLVMIDNAAFCFKMSSWCKNSFAIVSKSHSDSTQDICNFIDDVVEYENIPTGITVPARRGDGVETAPIDVVFTTSTLREGINIREGSAIRHVIICSADPIDIVQFVGRCRYCVDSIVVAPLSHSKWSKEYDELTLADTTSEWYTQVIPRILDDRDGTIVDQRAKYPLTIIPDLSDVLPQRISLLPFEEEIIKQYANDIDCDLDHAKRLGLMERREIQKLAQKERYYYRGERCATFVGAIRELEEKYGVKSKEWVEKKRKVVALFVDKEKLNHRIARRQLGETAKSILYRYCDPTISDPMELKCIPQEDYQDLRVRAIRDKLFGDRSGMYKIDHILRALDGTFGYRLVEVPRLAKNGKIEKRYAFIKISGAETHSF